MSGAAPDPAARSIGAVHFQLRVPLADFVDYRRLQRLIIAPFVRSQLWRRLALGVPIGAIVVLLVGASLFDWNFWAELLEQSGSGQVSHLMTIDGAGLWLAAAVVFFIGYSVARIEGLLIYNTYLRTIYAGSSEPPSDWMLVVGDAGLQTVIHGVVTTIPWSTVRGILEERSASFLMMKHSPWGLVVSHRAFAGAEDRSACLDFMRSRVPAAGGQPPA